MLCKEISIQFTKFYVFYQSLNHYENIMFIHAMFMSPLRNSFMHVYFNLRHRYAVLFVISDITSDLPARTCAPISTSQYKQLKNALLEESSDGRKHKSSG